ncbi:hypothetical protein BDW_13670 [Bdellovibrio bacteriovorus W]|nr:hypothetical protein BDW_13670 [Bdellovibrio bacteriovorus W]
MSYTQQTTALKFATFFVITSCYLVIAASLVFGLNLKSLLSQWGEDVQMTVYLSPEITEIQKQAIEKDLKAQAAVENFEFISQTKALDDFREQIASYAPDVTKDEDLLTLIPASYQISLHRDIPITEQTQALKSVELAMVKQEGVDEVSYGQDWIEKYSALLRVVDIVFYALIFIIVIASLFVASNSLRASIANRRDEIVVLEMIGATFTSIRRPYLIEGALTGLFSAILAIALSALGVYLFKSQASGALSFLKLNETIRFLSVMGTVGFVAVGAGIGALASFMCVRSINDGYAGSRR